LILVAGKVDAGGGAPDLEYEVSEGIGAFAALPPTTISSKGSSMVID
jgi:hypothetical protein